MRSISLGSRCEARYLENMFGPLSLLASLAAVRLLRLRVGSCDALKKERDRHTQHVAQLMEAAGTDSVFGLLVFVQLLGHIPQARRDQICAAIRSVAGVSSSR